MRYGFIGLGNMASAIIAGMVKNGFVPRDILGYNIHRDKADALSLQFGITVCGSIGELVQDSDAVVLAVKPQKLNEVLPDVQKSGIADKLIITIAAGKPISFYENALGDVAVVRAMPNLNAAVGASATGLCHNSRAGESDVEAARRMFLCVGSVTDVEERLFPVFSAIAGASPAFTFMYIDALARAAVQQGMPKATALEAAANAVLGSAKLVLDSAEHPMALADRVCSPGGTTIEGVMALREYGFESAVHDAVSAVVEKDEKLAK